MVITLRQAENDDIPVLLALEKSVAGTKIYSPMLTEDEWLVALEIGIVYLIEQESVSIGSISCEKKGESHVHISGFVVGSGFQNRGVGHQTMKKLLEELKDVKRIDLAVHPENVRALKLYKSFGFKEESREENYYGDGEPRLILVLQK